LKKAVVILLKRNCPDEILLGYKKTGFGIGKFSTIGGKINPGETPIDAIVRELYEETGVCVVPESLCNTGHVTFTFPARPDWNLTFKIYTSDTWDGVPKESEEITPRWFITSQLPYAEMWPDSVLWLPLVLQGYSIDASFLQFFGLIANISKLC
jgi:8-oxo-dGTP diphosphatase